MPEQFDLISIGAVLIDMIAMVDEFPGEDGESFVKDFKLMPGGAAANVAVICSRLGMKTAFSGKIGKDQFGDILKADLIKEKIHVDKTLITSEAVNTGSCYICVNHKGERMIMAYSGAADTLTIDDLQIELLTKAKWVNLSDLRNVSAIEALLESDTKFNFSMSPGALIAKNPSRAFRLAQHANLIVASESEMMQIFRSTEDEIETITKQLIDEKPEKIIAVTRGSRGAIIYMKNTTIEIPIFPVNVVDTTGAGDAFTAGMIYGLISNKKPKEAGRIAAACSAICIQSVGARSGPNSKRELIKFLKSNKNK
ncbi:MAG: carbohydrate kinase family protein [Asgard group archaeon]|nr:carbohydrate kinase family protein [Asgard group archaeon]